ncbi:MAG: ATP-binding protein, partial [bacterium]
MEYYPRKIEEKLDKWMERDEIIIVKGPRQSGKTTLLMHLREQFGGEYVTLEDEDAFETFDKAPLKFAERYMSKSRFLYVDEAQYSANAGKNLKLIYDRFRPKIKLVVTGSGSFDTKVQVGKYLVGRAVYMELLPLSFEEFILWKAKDLHKIYSDWRKGIAKFITGGTGIDTEPAFQKEFTELLEEYLIYGGFPAIVKERETSVKQELLKNLSRTYLERDVFFFFDIREMEKFRLLLSYLSLITGSIVEFSSISSELHMDFRTVEGYLSILLQTYVIYLLYPFYTNKLNELKKSKKVYFIDTGLRNSIIRNFLPLSSRTD